MAFTDVRLERSGAIAHLVLHRPTALNALSPQLIEDALQAVQQVAASDARVLILSGAGGAFSAGVDLKIAASPDYTRAVAKAHTENARALCHLLETMPQATIAQVAGHCFTGGLEIAIACDLMVAADDAIFCDSHGKLGLRPGWGLSQRLPRRIGTMRAKEMSLTGRRVSGREAAAIGLVLEAVAPEHLETRVAALAEAIASNDRGSVAAYKALYRAAESLGLEEGLAFEAGFRPPRPAGAEPRPPLSSHLKGA
ncbi:MAG: enoyl-CoA hydratase/carnithine racemase [Phenylobacterium sp.]|nr:enoyl-CoA hydratase/carnithine racemase [Phenylobacterium sp.]